MKICFLLPAHWSGVLGGAEIQVRYLMEELKRQGGFDTSYICRHTAQANDRGVPVYQVKHTLLKRLARFIYSIDHSQVMTFLNELSPDVIYTRTDSPYVGTAALYCKKASCRLVWHVAHQRDVERYRIRDLRSLTRYVDRRLFEYGVKHADVIIGQAEYQNALLKKNFGRSCVDIIPNFHPEAGAIMKPAQPIRVVWIANIKSAKRPEAFISLAGMLRHCHDVEFLMIGSIQDQSWEDRLQREVDQLENLTYLGGLPIEKVNEILTTSHIFVNTSESEGFPNSFIQAWLRKNVVVSLSIDPDKVLADGGYGYLSGNLQQLADDVLYLATHERERQALGERSYQYALDTFSLRNTDRLIAHFRQDSPA